MEIHNGLRKYQKEELDALAKQEPFNKGSGIHFFILFT
jgi:hypothetical protein